MAKSHSLVSSTTAPPLHTRLILPILFRWWESLFGLSTKPPTVGELYGRLLQLIAETQGDVSEEVTHTLKQVSVGLGFLAFDRFPTWQQVTFIQELRRKQAYEGIDRVVLTPSESHILEHVASVVHLPFESTQTTLGYGKDSFLGQPYEPLSP